MPCPFFKPDRPLEGSLRVRTPLGELYSGTCHTQPETFRPDEEAMRRFCNFGYARGGCPRFPREHKADAIRFSTWSEDVDRIRLVYIVEANHSPAQYGKLEFRIETAQCQPMPASELLRAQAHAFVEAHLRRRATRAAAAIMP